MSARANFDALIERAMAVREHGQMRPVIEKELLHYDIAELQDVASAPPA